MEVFLYYILMTNTLVASPELFNAALFKHAIQSSTFETFDAYKGVDGNADGYLLNDHCQHTGQELIPWWMVDLRGQFVVEKIQLTNRQDVYMNEQMALRLRNFSIEIFQTDPRQLDSFPKVTGQVCYYQTDPLGPSTFNFTCPVPIVGRFVRIVMRLDVSDYLHICEMEVLARNSILEENTFRRIPNMTLTG
nr:fucolectin-like; partial [Biomphalaria glabrata]